jgi:hypothetical protein
MKEVVVDDFAPEKLLLALQLIVPDAFHRAPRVLGAKGQEGAEEDDQFCLVSFAL